MKVAKVFRNGEDVIITADEVLKNRELYKDVEFVDPEEEFRVKFVKDCKGHKGPYFRLYLSKEDYKRLTPERKTRYDIISEQRHLQNGLWHTHWEEKVRPHGKTEYYIKTCGCKSSKYKRTDFYYDEGKTCVEFQHSYIAGDFNERNEFYTREGLNVVWLYDLMKMPVKAIGNGVFELLEDNAKGFFRIAEEPSNLRDYPVFIQVKGGLIYRVDKLERKEIDNELKSTVRLFIPVATFTEDEFVDGIINCRDVFKSKKSIYELWDKSYKMMIVTDGKDTIKITGGNDGEIYKDYRNGQPKYAYVNWYGTHFKPRNNKEYSLKIELAKEKKWRLVHAYEREKCCGTILE